jgi:hypothetical protein
VPAASKVCEVLVDVCVLPSADRVNTHVTRYVPARVPSGL